MKRQVSDSESLPLLPLGAVQPNAGKLDEGNWRPDSSADFLSGYEGREAKRFRRRQRKLAKSLEAEAKTDLKNGVEVGSGPPALGRKNKFGGRVLHAPFSEHTMFLGPTTQVAGLYPFTEGAGSPSLGVPLGPHSLFGETVCLDPFLWLDAGLINSPGVFVIAELGVGKSAMVKRLISGMAGFGHRPMILGDVKPDYPDLIRELGGQVISLGFGGDRINPLDAGPIASAAGQLRDHGHHVEAEQLVEESRNRRLSLLMALCQVARSRGSVSEREEIILGAALRIFDEAGLDSPLIADVLGLIADPTDELLSAALYSSDQRELMLKDAQSLRDTLHIMLEGTLKGLFDGPTTTPIDLNAPALEIDISAISGTDDAKKIAASLIAIWAYCFGTVDAVLALADAGIIQDRINYVAVLDELWRALRGGEGLVDRIDALTRVNRQKSMSQIMVTHSLDDLQALPTEADRRKARGLIDRSAVKIVGAVSAKELDALDPHVGGWSKKERDMVLGWSAPPSWDPSTPHPGRGSFALVAGGRRSVPFHVQLTAEELAMYGTTHVGSAVREVDGKGF